VKVTNYAMPAKGEHQSKRNNMKLRRRKLRRNMAVKIRRGRLRRRDVAGVCIVAGSREICGGN